MAGHSKWANIQHRKNAQDAKRGKVFTKLIREITVAARMGGGDAMANPRLRLAIDKALAANMTKDTVERAVKRGSGETGDTHYDEIRYEGYGPGGVAVMVDTLTDNRNRTVAEVRHTFSKSGGNLGAEGSVAYLFQAAGVLVYEPQTDHDALLEAALEAGAEDIVRSDDGSFEVLTTPEEYEQVRDGMRAADLPPASAELTQRPATLVTVSGEEAAAVLALLERLDELDDVQNVYANVDFADDAVAAG